MKEKGNHRYYNYQFKHTAIRITDHPDIQPVDVADHSAIAVARPGLELAFAAHMNNIEYVKLNEIHSAEFVLLLNKRRIREHLVDNPLFDADTVKAWLDSKIAMDSAPGCKIRAIILDAHLAGWCGIQLENEKYEIAIVVDYDYWGIGKLIFREIMDWARDLGHKTVFMHLLHTRPEYKFLRKISKNVYQSELMGSKFTSYELTVE